jgi:hypothetical protein
VTPAQVQAMVHALLRLHMYESLNLGKAPAIVAISEPTPNSLQVVFSDHTRAVLTIEARP